MQASGDSPRALFLSDEGTVFPDSVVCAGLVPGRELGAPCPHSDAGRMPLPRRIEARAAHIAPGRGRPGHLAPPCAVQALGSLALFLGARAASFGPELQPLRVFKCRLMYLLVVPGLRDERPGEIQAPDG